MVYGGVRAQHYLFLKSILYGVEKSASRPGYFTPIEREAVGPTADRHVSENRKIMPANESGTDQAAVRRCCLSEVNFSHYLLVYVSSATIQTFLSSYLRYAKFHCTSTLLLSSCLHSSRLPFLFPYPIPQHPHTQHEPCYPTCLLHNAATQWSRIV
jgi:hypothetical protein